MKKLVFITFILGCIGCRSFNHLAYVNTSGTRITGIANDTSMLTLTESYRTHLNTKMNEVLAQIDEMLIKDKPESTLTNWVADAIYNQSKKYFTEDIAFAYQNYGGIRIPSIGKGDITLGKIYELMPFDNIAVLVKISGEELLKFGQYIADIDGAPISVNAKIIIENKKLVSMLINSTAVETNKTYYVAMPDYIANGGDNQTYLMDNERIDKNILIRDMLAAEAKSQQRIKAGLDKRIELIK